MKAIVGLRYGPVSELEAHEIDPPAVGEQEVRVRVRAAGLHVGDVFSVLGAPFPVRVSTGLLRPRYGVPGFDLAGEVEAIGSAVTRFGVGDRVFGIGRGTCAELTLAAEGELQPMPANLSFVEAAAIPTSGLAALHGLRDAGRVQPGQSLLINGASGGVGTFAVQIGKALGARVTAVCGPGNVELVRSLGADAVIDYTVRDFTTLGPRHDVILDNVENHTLAAVRRALKPRGTLVLNSGTGAAGLALLGRLVKPLLLSPFSGQSLRRYLSVPKREDLAALGEMVEAGTLRPVVGRSYSLLETPMALRHIAGGHASGKVVIAIA